MADIVQIGDATLYHGDCLEILPMLDKVDAVVTDPPYGVGYDPQVHKLYSSTTNNRTKIVGDDKEPDLSVIFDIDAPKVMWGAENYYKQLPHRGRWICWFKRSGVTRPNSMHSGDFELAWMDKTSGFYKYVNVVHGGVINADSTFGNNQKRDHPTQKPIAVMEFSIQQFKKLTTVLDPFMGSGTTGVACANLGRKFIGIEIERKYFNIACERIDAAYSQMRLFA